MRVGLRGIEEEAEGGRGFVGREEEAEEAEGAGSWSIGPPEEGEAAAALEAEETVRFEGTKGAAEAVRRDFTTGAEGEAVGADMVVWVRMMMVNAKEAQAQNRTGLGISFRLAPVERRGETIEPTINIAPGSTAYKAPYLLDPTFVPRHPVPITALPSPLPDLSRPFIFTPSLHPLRTSSSRLSQLFAPQDHVFVDQRMHRSPS
jgi:hypothetical protein